MNQARIKKLKDRKKKIAESGERGNLIFVKADETIRVRPLPVDENEEFGLEVVQFYLGPEIRGVISPKTFNMPCAIHEMYMKLKDSKKANDKELAGKMKPKRKYVVPVIKYKDSRGKEVDDQNSPRLVMLTQTPYQQMIDYSLDPEHGDFTDPAEGYDIKITRTGSSLTDTEYNAMNCKSTKLPAKYNKIYDTKEMLMKEVPSYEETKEILKKFMGEEDEEPVVRKKKKKKRPTE